MGLIEFSNGKVNCPRCDGIICLVPIKKSESEIFVCDNCGAYWNSFVDIIKKGFRNITTYRNDLQDIITDYSLAESNWIDEKILVIEDSYHLCQLLNIIIWEGDCYDINAYQNQMVNSSILSGLEKEIGRCIESDDINRVCNQCKHSW